MAGVVDFQDEEQVKSFLENMEVEGVLGEPLGLEVGFQAKG